MNINSGSGSARGGYGGADQDPDDWVDREEERAEPNQTNSLPKEKKLAILEKIIISSAVTAGVIALGASVYYAGRGIYNYFN
ncbi:MAG: hypothetical protein Q7S56_01275 [Nanoarchaeota archaeon]|nr:hypothetical protein [Nanoarchaeota archaeon]